MIEKLPYTLSEGVTATREGLVIDNDAADAVVHTTLQWLGRDRLSGYAGRIFDWSDVAELLQYREGEPWCEVDGDGLFCGPPGLCPWTREALNRIAAILCDDAEAFRVLHWCVTNL